MQEEVWRVCTTPCVLQSLNGFISIGYRVDNREENDSEGWGTGVGEGGGLVLEREGVGGGDGEREEPVNPAHCQSV